MFGLAYGDALGKPTEFLRYEEILDRYGVGGPQELDGDPALVTDDTQMGLAVADALLSALEERPLTPQRLEPRTRGRFLHWAASDENNRAPGMTCMRAIGRLGDGRPWVLATEQGSKGCGANMRVTPVGLVPGLSGAERAGAAQLQAAMTHGHPTALAASELTAYTVHLLVNGLAPRELPRALRERCREQREVYRGDWLGDLWQRPGETSEASFIARGWDECLGVLDRLDAALAAPDRTADPCLATGAGWIAEEAFATALHCFLLFESEPVAMLGRAAATSGDSDSIACLAGAFAGAAHGMGAWPAEWAERIEYAAELDRIGRAWD
ncbi:ADP-ribosylglycohydrolase family protein [Allocatelliglobosispora scoriae]|nr:ADP-ribosylglycohydrolase family protein [Allocatelliglobosispora scoriae]